MPYLPEINLMTSWCDSEKKSLESYWPLGWRPCTLAGQAGNPFTWRTFHKLNHLKYKHKKNYFEEQFGDEPWQKQDPLDWRLLSLRSFLVLGRASAILTCCFMEHKTMRSNYFLILKSQSIAHALTDNPKRISQEHARLYSQLVIVVTTSESCHCLVLFQRDCLLIEALLASPPTCPARLRNTQRQKCGNLQ